MSISVNTDIIDYIFKAKTIDNNQDIVLLESDVYRGLFTIGTDHKLYAFDEQTGVGEQFSRRIICENCTQFAATRMGGSYYFAMALISEDNIYTCVTKEPDKVEQSSFTRLDFAGVPGINELKPVGLFVNCNELETTIAIMMKNSDGKIKQYVAYLTVDKPTTYMYYGLACNFDTVISSVCGRAAGQMVDGVYTLGTYGRSDQLLYTPMRNVFSTLPPDPIRLATPKTGLECIALCNLENGGTHLFGVGDNVLFLYPYKKQFDCGHISDSNYDKILTSSYFFNPVRIETYIDSENRKIYVWVLNKKGELSYTFASIDSGNECGEFVEPVIFKHGVSFFSVKPDTLALCTESKFMIGSRNRETGGYSFSSVAIQTDTDEATINRVFATKIITENPCEKIRLSAEEPIEAYINNIYYRFTELIIETDYLGVVNVIQIADGINPPPFNVSIYSEGEDSEELIEVYAGKDAYNRLLELTTPEKLKSEKIIDLHGRETSLTKGLTDEQITLAASTISELSRNYQTIQMRNGAQGLYRISPAAENGLSDDIKHALSEAWDYVCNIAKDFWDNILGRTITFATEIVSDSIHFIIKIGDKILRFELDTIGKIMKCAVKVLEFIGIPTDKILDWLMVFFDIDGAIRAKNVIEAFAEKGYGKMNDLLIHSEEYIDKKLEEAITSVEQWTGTVELPETEISGFPISSILRPSNMFFFDHVFCQGGFLTVDLPVVKMSDKVQNLMNESLNEMETLAKEYPYQGFYTILEELAGELGKFSNNVTVKDLQTILPVIKKIAALYANKYLNLIKKGSKCIFKLFTALLDYFWELLTQKIHIPYISTVLEYLGVSEYSILDICCMVPAFPANLLYYTATGKSLISAKEMESYTDIDFPQIPNIFSNVTPYLTTTDGWEDYYDLEAMSKAEVPDKDSIVALRVLICACTLSSTGIALFKMGTGDDSCTINIVSLGLTLAGFSLSLGLGYGIWAPMDYNHETANKKYNTLFLINTPIAIMLDALQFINKLNKSKFLKIFSPVINVLLAALSFVFEFIACVNANMINLNQKTIQGYTMNPEVLKKDRRIYTVDTISYMIDDAITIFDIVVDFVPEKNIETLSSVSLWGRCMAGLCSGIMLVSGYITNIKNNFSSLVEI